jgi:hypothetical protein
VTFGKRCRLARAIRLSPLTRVAKDVLLDLVGGQAAQRWGTGRISHFIASPCDDHLRLGCSFGRADFSKSNLVAMDLLGAER